MRDEETTVLFADRVRDLPYSISLYCMYVVSISREPAACSLQLAACTTVSLRFKQARQTPIEETSKPSRASQQHGNIRYLGHLDYLCCTTAAQSADAQLHTS
jgi:hypothetical protein